MEEHLLLIMQSTGIMVLTVILQLHQQVQDFMLHLPQQQEQLFQVQLIISGLLLLTLSVKEHQVQRYRYWQHKFQILQSHLQLLQAITQYKSLGLHQTAKDLPLLSTPSLWMEMATLVTTIYKLQLPQTHSSTLQVE